MTTTFTVTTRVPAPPAVVYELSLSVDLHTASMADSGETAIAGVTSGTLALGDTVTWRARHFGVWFRMTSEIAEAEPPRRFVDQQVRGPFASFHHEHVFEDDGDGGTVMRDTITLRAPLGPVGAAVERLGLTAYLRALIVQRNETIVEVARGLA